VSRRTDYIEIADAIKRARSLPDVGEDEAAYWNGVDAAAHEIARLFERKSTAFNATLFLENCGVIEP
jgi:hypothetical protein